MSETGDFPSPLLVHSTTVRVILLSVPGVWFQVSMESSYKPIYLIKCNRIPGEPAFSAPQVGLRELICCSVALLPCAVPRGRRSTLDIPQSSTQMSPRFPACGERVVEAVQEVGIGVGSAFSSRAVSGAVPRTGRQVCSRLRISQQPSKQTDALHGTTTSCLSPNPIPWIARCIPRIPKITEMPKCGSINYLSKICHYETVSY